MSKVLPYRADIDTLRAIAVLAVVIFHIEKSWLPGGFLGVDIFFVISGFLITMILHREMSKGEFSFKNFYIRRIKRILPAFMVMVGISMIVAVFIFTKDDFFILWKSALASLGFAANLYYARGQGYFEPIQEEKPLLHIWSLSVEEQYYFIFPILLLLFIKKSWKIQFTFLISLIFLSIVASFIPVLAEKYYLPHLRAFEMLFGSLTAVWMQYQQQQGKFIGEQYAAFASIVSLITLFACLFLFTQQTPYFPGPAAIIPCLAAATLIYFNNFDHKVKNLFRWKWVVSIGLISYSLYLWHWPVLAFTRYITGENTLPHRLIFPSTALILVLSIASYFLVEKPFKNWKRSFEQSALYLYVLPTLLIAAFSYMLLKSPYMNQYNDIGLARSYTSCHNNTNKKCVWGDESQKPNILILGDSHADQYKTFFDYVGKKEKWAATMVSSDTCAYADGYDAKIFHKNASCRAMYEYAEQHLPNYPIVILAMRWSNQMAENSTSVGYDPDFFKKFASTLAKLSKEKQQVVIFMDNQKIQYPALRAYQLEQRLNRFEKKLKTTEDFTAQANQRIRQLAEQFANVRIIDVAALIPDNLKIDGLPVYSDLDHINPYGGEALAKKFVENRMLLQNPKHPIH
ncbi:acyltransferase family protein [Neisseria iguanae]|uniref:Acyltransferase n=1 Tax=Neisseria iguanae TaxID=90242 RepID=A0A2P7TX05_9NEIS|nr:acyltransferase family protein [Neisseria iguanae]PSJ79269.1 acyltransferase [Neisseria iguanae]